MSQRSIRSFLPVNFCYFVFSFWKFSSILTLKRIGITSYQLKIAWWEDLPNGQTVTQVIAFGMNVKQYVFYFWVDLVSVCFSEIIYDRKYCHSCNITVNSTFCKRLCLKAGKMVQWKWFTLLLTWWPGFNPQSQHGRKGEPTHTLSFDLCMCTYKPIDVHTE